MCTFQSYYHPSGKKMYIDAQFEESSNWLRWVNSARWAEEQNMFPIEHAGEVYYLLIRDTKAGDELLGNCLRGGIGGIHFQENDLFYGLLS
jgi:hemin uptake protein HemP